MGKLLAALLILQIVAGCGLAQEGAQPDFRRTSWGMTQAQVIASESGQPAEVSQADGETIVRYDSVKQGDLPGRLLYFFVEGKLVRAKYISNVVEHARKNDFIADFRAVEPVLMEKYGKPASDRAVWDNDQLQLERLPYLDQDRALASDILASDANAGLSVSLGYLRLYTQRVTPRTKIVHALTGGDSKIVHQIEYRSAQFESLENAAIHAQRGHAE